MSTIFSKIIDGDIPSYKIAENDKYYAFLDISPIQKGHTLVVPKRVVDYYFDLTDDEMAEIMAFAKKIALSIKQSLNCKKVAIIVLGLEVPHAHIHLIPINEEGDIDFKKDRLKLSPEEFEDIKNKIMI